MIDFLVACASQGNAAAGGGCYDWPVIKQIIDLLGYVVKYIYKFLEIIGIPNLGLCIILLTIVVKCILIPLTIKQQKFTKLSSYAQPEIRAIQAKYQGKRDNFSMQAMQEETKAVYAKYGISQTGGCLQSFIQFPIIIALYGVIRQIPLYVDSFRQYYVNIINAIGNIDLSDIQGMAGWATMTDMNQKITTLCNINTQTIQQIAERCSGDTLAIVTENSEKIQQLNTFCGINLGETPWHLIIGGGIGILAVIIPILSGVSQWLSVKLGQASNASGQDPTAASMKTMTLMMPLVSVFFCFTLNASIGLYWSISSIFQVILQIIINRHYRKVDMNELIKENMAKAAEKAKKKGNKKKEVSGSALTQAANTSTKNMQSQAPRTIADRARVSVDGSADTAQTPPPANSLAARAQMVQKYNEENGVEVNNETGTSHKKYKK
ncbi:MAG: YidC/Oxa1 family membrane protein insertase [Parasporobacterium sp.]|nr:YidC/Oxa1 family membrane protein insertase [Parasporobacterium sp.]